MARSKKMQKPVINPNDMYVTPGYVVDMLAHLCDEMLPMQEWVIDIGAGDARIGRQVRSAFRNRLPLVSVPRLVTIDPVPDWDEIVEDIDEPYVGTFENGEWLRSIVRGRILFVSNPPFSQAFDIIQNARWMLNGYAPGSAMVFLLRQNWFATLKRAEWLTANPYNRNVSIAPRPVFENEYKDNPKGQSDSNEYGLFFWFNGDASKTFWPHSVRIGKK